jgi:hypothetical protein
MRLGLFNLGLPSCPWTRREEETQTLDLNDASLEMWTLLLPSVIASRGIRPQTKSLPKKLPSNKSFF